MAQTWLNLECCMGIQCPVISVTTPLCWPRNLLTDIWNVPKKKGKKFVLKNTAKNC